MATNSACGEFVGRFIRVAQRLEIFNRASETWAFLPVRSLSRWRILLFRSLCFNKKESDASSSKFFSKLIAKEPPAVGRIKNHAASISNVPDGICEECLVSPLRHLFGIKSLFFLCVHHAPVKRHSGQSFPQHVRRKYLPVEFASEHSRERALSRSDATHHYHDHWL